MIFSLPVTADACEIGLETKTRALSTLVRSVWLMSIVTMLALATCPPLMNVESLPSWEPVHANFLRSPGYELVFFALALVAVCLHAFREHLLIMKLKRVSTEAPGVLPNLEAVIGGSITPPGDIHA
jgi:hypothetical protein